jgi:prepilin signal peptidase PulO-like enzyme (type II secretory pathway)
MLELGEHIILFGSIVYVFVFLLGLSLGSFLNSWMWRARENIRIISNTRSMCVSCRRQLLWYENIPVVSWIFLNGKCRTCKKKISAIYPLVEIVSAFLLLFVFHQHLKLVHFSEWALLRDTFFLTLLVVIFVYDWRYQIIFPSIIWAGTIIGFLINIFFLNFSISSLLLAAAIGGGFFLLQFLISNGRWIGGGDVRMGVMMGAWLGYPNIFVALFVAYILGALVGIILLLFKKASIKTEIPFGTFLALGTFFTIYYGDNLLNWYLTLLK